MAQTHIAIVGAGPVGLACALAVAQLRGTEVSLIERRKLAPAALAEGFDNRVYALSPATRSLLESLRVWPHLDAARIAPIRAMQVVGDADANQPGELALSHGAPLAFIVEHSALLNALQAELYAQSGRVRVIDDIEMGAIDFASASLAVHLLGRPALDADLLVAADGSASAVRALAGIEVATRDYDSDGVVANFSCAHAHGGIARQWFSADGVLAWLPLPGKRISIVWSVSHARASELTALDDAAFAEAVAAAGGHELGALAPISPRARVPLRRASARQWVRPRLALIGDAAHAIHPLAGQGANLGFADVAELATVLRERSPLSAAGDLAVLRRFERARREDALLMGEITDNLRSLYLSNALLAKLARRDGMNLVNRSSATKAILIAHAIK